MIVDEDSFFGKKLFNVTHEIAATWNLEDTFLVVVASILAIKDW
jgi:hypothetical protein